MSKNLFIRINKNNKHLCDKLSRYVSKKGALQHNIIGLELQKGFIHKFINFNTFEFEAIKIPKNYKKSFFINNNTKKYCFIPEIIQKKIINNTVYTPYYFIRDDTFYPFLVYISKTHELLDKYKEIKENIINNVYNVKICKMPFIPFYDEIDWNYGDMANNKFFYHKIIKNYYSIKSVYIGKDLCKKEQSYEKINNISNKGNTILLKITNKKYIYIGTEIYKFIINDVILEYHSPIHYDNSPFPVIVGSKNIYYLSEKKYISKHTLEKYNHIDFKNSYKFLDFFEDIDNNNKNNNKYETILKPIKILSIIHNKMDYDDDS